MFDPDLAIGLRRKGAHCLDYASLGAKTRSKTGPIRRTRFGQERHIFGIMPRMPGCFEFALVKDQSKAYAIHMR
jgi:hypothetical protein